MKHTFTLLPLLVLAACAPNDFSMDSAPEDTSDTYPAGTLRIDVYPPSSDANLLPQSHIVSPGSYTGLTLDLLRTVTISGNVTGDVSRGWNLVGAPTTEEPLVATISAQVSPSILGGVTESDESGRFSLSFPAYPDPTWVSIVPSDASLAPFRVVEDTVFDGDTARWDQHLPTGIPVYGRVDGTYEGVAGGQAGVSLRLSRSVGGAVVKSATFTTDRSGWYVGRVDEMGEYTLEVVGGETDVVGRVVPDMAIPVLVENEDGVEVDVELGDVADTTAAGTLVDAEGKRVGGGRVRLTSRRLDGSTGSLVVEEDANDDGDFIARLLPGVYDVELIPPYSGTASLSPSRLDSLPVGGDVDLGGLPLGGAARLSATIVDPDGNPAADVLVTATEQGFDGYVWYARTSADGSFSLPVSDVPLQLALTPAQGQGTDAVTYVSVADPGALGTLALAEGVAVAGSATFEGAAVPFAPLEVHDAVTGLLLAQGVTGENGQFSLSVVLPATVEDPGGDTGDTERDTGGDTGGDAGGDTGGDTGGPADTAGDSGGDSGGRGDTGSDTAI